MTNRKDRLHLPGSGGAEQSLVSEEKETRPKFETLNTDEAEQCLGSRVTFSEESVAIETESRMGRGSSREIAELTEETVQEDDREGWDNKMQFMMGVISYAVGLGNVWRFPYLCQKNGGGAFLIPYMIMMVLEGMPLFLIELGIGQRLRTGPVGVWNAIHPYLGGVGVSAAIVSYMVGLYYNVILTWCIYYLYKSFSLELPWTNCPTYENGTAVVECARSTTPTNYFWNREAINTSDSIGEFGGFTTHMTFCLVLAWTLIYLCVMKGIKSSGKVMYITATFPYLVTTIFLFRSAALDGAVDGLVYMFTPDLTRLYDPEVWLEAATQIFYSMGLGFGGLIAFGSYNKIKNNCKRDVLLLSVANLITSLYTALVIFCVLGYMGNKNFKKCIEDDMRILMDLYPGQFSSLEELKANVTFDEYLFFMEHNFHMSAFPLMAEHTQNCNYQTIIGQAAEGTGLAFVVFTEAIIQFPFPQIWAIMFFLMLLMLGLGSMFGTLEGVITSLNDSHMIQLKKPVMTAILCASACVIGLVFTTRSGQYWVSMFDHFAGSYALMCVAFFEIFAVIYVYGFRRFIRDLEFMTGETVSNFWVFTWRFVSPVIMVVLFVASVVKSFTHIPEYSTYDHEKSHQHNTPYPTWALFIAFGMVCFAMAPVPVVWFVRKFKIIKMEGDIPAAAKCLGATPSTTYMLKSEPSFNRMVESTASELQNMGTKNPSANGNAASKPHTNGNRLTVYPPPSAAVNGTKHHKNNGNLTSKNGR
ncbi:Transporter [Aphelenchoides besseyi]|nr:Transporter [Aphelenchoides besseyi]KAI6235269.1 Transporter [Aphelenchoides besseyi]